MIKDWEVFSEILYESIADIRKEYFKIERYRDLPTLRERVYCYELYHQLRRRLPEDFPYLLHGEIDKSGYDWIAELFGGSCPNPDFVVHVPGKPKNLVVIEVKTKGNKKSEIQKDIGKLNKFITKVNYYRGILLLFGSDEIQDMKIPDKRIIAMCHNEPGQRPRIMDWY